MPLSSFGCGSKKNDGWQNPVSPGLEKKRKKKTRKNMCLKSISVNSVTGMNENTLIVQKIIILKALYERLNVKKKYVHSCKKKNGVFRVRKKMA